MPQMYTLTVTLPSLTPPGDNDVVTRRVSISTNGTAPVVTDYPVATTTITYTVIEDAVLVVSLTHLDERGNESVPSTLSLTVYDTTPPGQPGPMTYTLVPVSEPPNPPPSGDLISTATPAGVWYVGNSDWNYAAGLTHRIVDGELRFLTLNFRGNIPGYKYQLTELRLPTESGPAEFTNTWGDVWDGGYDGAMTHNSLWYDEATGRLWHGGALDYPQGGVSTSACTCLSTRVLNADGTHSNLQGFYGIEGVGQRVSGLGGVKPVPAAFATANGVGSYVVGHGGYTSLMSQGLGAALGPVFCFCTDPSAQPPQPWGSETPTTPASAVKFGADYRAVPGQDWYGGPRTYDRGVQVTPTVNYLDGGDPRSNPSTPPTDPPVAGAEWVGPIPGDPDGIYNWGWVATYGNTLNWVSGTPGGICLVATVASGKQFYQTSSVRSDGVAAELHVFDPADVAAALADPTSQLAKTIRPKRMIPLSLPGWTEAGQGGAILGATIPEGTNKLYVLASFCGPSPVVVRMYVFDLS